MDKKCQKLETIRQLRALIAKILVVILVGIVVLRFVFGIGIVMGEGMYPRMRDGDVVVYYRLVNEQNIGDIVTFTVDGKRQYARIIAKGGDIVDMNEDGQLLVNGNVQEEEVFFETSKEERKTEFPCRVSVDTIFVLGDHRTATIDSRDYGTVDLADIDGKVITLLRRRGL